MGLISQVALKGTRENIKSVSYYGFHFVGFQGSRLKLEIKLYLRANW